MVFNKNLLRLIKAVFITLITKKKKFNQLLK